MSCMTVRMVCISCILALLAGCGERESGQHDSPVNNTIQPGDRVYAFIPGTAQASLRIDTALAVEFVTEMPIMMVLDTLLQVLEYQYFAHYGGKATDIMLDMYSLEYVATPGQWYRVAVVAILDPDSTAFQTFFQGSAGAAATYLALMSTVTQPQRDPALINGVIFLYNGKSLRELSHIDLSGIQTPRTVEPAVESYFSMRAPAH